MHTGWNVRSCRDIIKKRFSRKTLEDKTDYRDQAQNSVRQPRGLALFYTWPAPFTLLFCSLSSCLFFHLHTPLWLCTVLQFSSSFPIPVSRISTGLQSYQLQSPGGSSWKGLLQFLDSPSVGEIVSCHCLHVSFVRLVSLLTLLLASPFSLWFSNWPCPQSQNLAGIKILMLLYALINSCEWPGLIFPLSHLSVKFVFLYILIYCFFVSLLLTCCIGKGPWPDAFKRTDTLLLHTLRISKQHKAVL